MKTLLVNGKMCVGILNDDLMARIDPAVHDEVLKKKGGYWMNLALDFNERSIITPGPPDSCPDSILSTLP